MQTKPLFSIIIVAYKSQKVIRLCLKSILNSKFTNFEIIIVDCSPDLKTKQAISPFLSSKFITYVRSLRNLGYAAGNNLGAQYAGGDWLIILNPDCQVKSNWLNQAKRVISTNSGNIIQPLILDPKTKQVSIAGKIRSYLGFDYLQGYQTPITNWSKTQAISSISGSAVFVHQSLFHKLHGFDPIFFMYYEDSDFAWRAKLTGAKTILIPAIEVFHEYFFYSQNNSYLHQQKKWFLLERNRLMMILKNYSAKTLFFLTPILIISEVGLIFFALAHGFLLSKLKSYLSLLTLIPHIIAQRIQIQGCRTVSDGLTLKYTPATINITSLDSGFTRHVVNPLLLFYYRNLFKPFIK